MGNQFFYEVVSMDPKAPKSTGSFNVECVVRTAEYEPGRLIVLLNDFHEEISKKPKQSGKNGNVVMETVRETIASQIFMNEADSIRYRDMFEVKAVAVA
jgi:hypothetical protein